MTNRPTIKEEIEMYMNIAESEGADVHWLDLAQVLPYNRLTIKSIWHKRKSAMRNAEETGKYLSEQERKEFNSEFTVLMFVFAMIGVMVYFLIK